MAAYYQSPNRIRDGVLPIASANPHFCDQLAFGKLACAKVLCCIGAVNRILPYFIINMWMTTQDNGLAATLHGPAIVSALVGPGVGMKVGTITAYPFEETIRMTVAPDKPVAIPLYLRIPAWCDKPRVQVSGEVVATESVPGMKGYVRIRRTWTKGDAVTLTLPMPVKIVRGYENEYPSSLRQYFHIEPDSMFQKRREFSERAILPEGLGTAMWEDQEVADRGDQGERRSCQTPQWKSRHPSWRIMPSFSLNVSPAILLFQGRRGKCRPACDCAEFKMRRR